MKTESYREFIKTVLHKYYHVGNESVDLLLSISKIQHFQKDQLLLDIGKVSNQIYMLFEGVVVSCYLDKSGKEYHKNIFLKEDFVGSTVSAITQTPSNFALQAINDSTTISFDYNKYKKLINTREDLQVFYIQYLEQNWVIEKEKREVAIVMKTAKERYIEYITTHPNIEQYVPLHYIASHLGITPTQLSRIRKSKINSSNQHM